MNKKKLLIPLIQGLVVGTLICLLYFLGLFKNFEHRLTDSLTQPRTPSSQIVILSVDDQSIQKIGRWPWDRSVYAKLIEKIGDYPKSIGIDISFPEESTKDDDTALADALIKYPKVVLPIEVGSFKFQGSQPVAQTFLQPIPELKKNSRQGVVNVVTDTDGVTRKAPIKTLVNGKLVDHFTVETLKIYFQNNQAKLKQLESIPTEKGLMIINYVDKPGSFISYPIAKILDGSIDPKVLQDKIVLIGATAQDLHDSQITPVSNGTSMNGVEIHANALQTILEGKFLHTQSLQSLILPIFAIAIILSFVIYTRGILMGAAVTVSLLIGYILWAIYSFDHGVIRSIFYPVFGILLNYFVSVVHKYFNENKQKSYIRKAFSYYLSPSVMHEVLEDPDKLKLGGVKQDMSVLFSDIAGFTTISEKLEPEILVEFMNQYLSQMTKIVFDNDGVLDKYIGDAVMALWGAPLPDKDHALKACITALKMQEQMKEVQEIWKKEHDIEFKVRIGVNSGPMVVGNMGSEMRFDYTVLGDNVNLGARIEGINKQYGTYLCISEFTYGMVKDRVTARLLDVVAVKGKEKGVTLYELRSLGDPSDSEKLFLDEFEKARSLYDKGLFSKALIEFKVVAKKYPNDEPTKVYIERCILYIKNPPTHWDGVYKATSK